MLDGGRGLLAGLDLVYGSIPAQRCWVHKARNVLNRVRKVDHEEVKKGLHRISHAEGSRESQRMLTSFVFRWREQYPKAVECLQNDIDKLLDFFAIADSSLWHHIRNTNTIEWRFVEVRERNRPLGVFSDRTSMDRILFAIFTCKNTKEDIATPLL